MKVPKVDVRNSKNLSDQAWHGIPKHLIHVVLSGSTSLGCHALTSLNYCPSQEEASSIKALMSPSSNSSNR